jgi:hypothetical protein
MVSKVLTVKINTRTDELIEKLARRLSVTKSEFVRRAVDSYIEYKTPSAGETLMNKYLYERP